MAKDFKDLENLKKLLKASRDAQERTMLKNKMIELQKNSVRTSRSSGQLFSTTGIEKQATKTGKAFTTPKGGALQPLKSGQVANVRGALSESTALVPTTARESAKEAALSTTARVGGKVAKVLSKVAAPLAVAYELLDPTMANPVGISDETPYTKLRRAEKADDAAAEVAYEAGLPAYQQIPLRPTFGIGSDEHVNSIIEQDNLEEKAVLLNTAAQVSSPSERAMLLNEVQKPAPKITGQEESGPSSQFKEALTFFLPTLLGALGGAALGGAEGGVAGGQIATDLNKSYLDYKSEQLKNQVNKSVVGKTDVTPDFLIKGSGEPVFTQQQPDGTVKFITDTGKVVRGTQVESRQQVEQRLRNEDIQKRFDENLNLNQKKFKRNLIKGFEQTAASEIKAMKAFERVESLVESGTPFVGQIEFAMAKGIAGEVGNLSEGERKVAAQIVGFKGKLADLTEFLESNLSDMRKEEIVKLVKFMKPKTKARLEQQADNIAAVHAEDFNTTRKDFTNVLLQGAGRNPVKAEEASTEQRASALLEKIRKIKGGK